MIQAALKVNGTLIYLTSTFQHYSELLDTQTCTLAGILTNISTGDSLRFSIQCNLSYLNAVNDVRKPQGSLYQGIQKLAKHGCL